MKRNVTLFPRDTYPSPTGAIQMYTHDPALVDVIGQAKTIRFQIFVYRMSATARATIRVYESANPDSAPRDTGNMHTAIVRAAVGAHFQDVTGPLCGRIEVILEIDDSGGPAAQDMDIEVFATLILEE